MEQDYETVVVDFLSRKENIRVALEIGERIDQVKWKLAMDFWTALQESLASFLKDSDLSARWEMRVDDEISKDPYAQYATVSFNPKKCAKLEP
jgi:hypothetical protein